MVFSGLRTLVKLLVVNILCTVLPAAFNLESHHQTAALNLSFAIVRAFKVARILWREGGPSAPSWSVGNAGHIPLTVMAT